MGASRDFERRFTYAMLAIIAAFFMTPWMVGLLVGMWFILEWLAHDPVDR